MCRVRNRMIRCPCVSVWLRPCVSLWLRLARVAGLARVRRACGSHRVAARAGAKPRHYPTLFMGRHERRLFWDRRLPAGRRGPAGSRRSQGVVPLVNNPGYALAGGLLLMMLVLSPMAGRLQGTDAARAAPPGRVASLQAPRPPAATTTFVWSVRGLSTRAGQHIMTLYLSGCWAARQIARVTATSRPLRVRVDVHTGAITVDGLHNPVRPLTITVRFKTRLRSAPTGAHLALRWGATRNASVTLPVGGPACRAVPTLTSPLPPLPSTTFVWSLAGLRAPPSEHADLVELKGCWSARRRRKQLLTEFEIVQHRR